MPLDLSLFKVMESHLIKQCFYNVDKVRDATAAASKRFQIMISGDNCKNCTAGGSSMYV
jgi:hypothetical protein